MWAWTGTIGEIPVPATDLYNFDVAEGADAGFATSTLVTTTLNARKARFGGTVLLIVQLQDIVGKVATGVNGIDPARWNLTVQVPGQAPAVHPLESGPTGKAAFSITRDDPDLRR